MNESRRREVARTSTAATLSAARWHVRAFLIEAGYPLPERWCRDSTNWGSVRQVKSSECRTSEQPELQISPQGP